MQRPRVAGFTLLEVLIAMAIFSLISLASFTIFDTIIKNDDSSKRHSERLYELQRAFLIMQRDMLQIAHRSVRINGEAPLTGYLHTEQSGLEASVATLGFVRGGWRNPGLLLPRSDMQSVAYRLQDGVFERLHYNFVDAVVGQEPKIRPLVSGVSELNFEFYDGKKWQKQAPEQGLPLAIAVELDVDDFGHIRRQFLLAGDAPEPKD